MAKSSAARGPSLLAELYAMDERATTVESQSAEGPSSGELSSDEDENTSLHASFEEQPPFSLSATSLEDHSFSRELSVEEEEEAEVQYVERQLSEEPAVNNEDQRQSKDAIIFEGVGSLLSPLRGLPMYARPFTRDSAPSLLFSRDCTIPSPHPSTPHQTSSVGHDPDVSHSMDEILDESNSADEGDSEISVGVVKITSDDPKAAARAAAILKLVRLIVAAPSLLFMNILARLRLAAQSRDEETPTFVRKPRVGLESLSSQRRSGLRNFKAQRQGV